jgi:hypothetical protein
MFMTIVGQEDTLGFINPSKIDQISKGKYQDIYITLENGQSIELPRYLTHLSLVKNRVEAIQTLSKYEKLPDELKLILDKLLNPQNYQKEDLIEFAGVYFSEREISQYKASFTMYNENEKSHHMNPDKKTIFDEKYHFLLTNQTDNKESLEENKTKTLKI